MRTCCPKPKHKVRPPLHTPREDAEYISLVTTEPMNNPFIPSKPELPTIIISDTTSTHPTPLPNVYPDQQLEDLKRLL